MFMEDVKETLNEDFNEPLTENGAVGYRTSGRELLDMIQPSYRKNGTQQQYRSLRLFARAA